MDEEGGLGFDLGVEAGGRPFLDFVGAAIDEEVKGVGAPPANGDLDKGVECSGGGAEHIWADERREEEL